ncbi:hypothetical protein HG530_010481 [Fusarium avenaceum]|nr:hypothetical protein HG530_010481 [Fusarium avenaceum]
MATHTFWQYLRLKAIVTLIRLLNYIGTRSHFKPSTTCNRKAIRLPSRDLGRFIKAWIYYPQNYEEGQEQGVVVNWHGGASNESDVLVLDADYRKAPEHPFPAAVEDVEDVLRWVESQPRLFDTARVALSGFSSGANLALIASSELRQQFSINVRAVYAFYPGVDFTIPPEQKTVPNPIRPLPAGFQHLITEAYLPRVEDRKSPKASPMYADAAFFPERVLLFACSGDVFTPEIEAFGEKLEKIGCDVEIVRMEGAHGCDKRINPKTFNPEARDISYNKVVESLRNFMVNFLLWLSSGSFLKRKQALSQFPTNFNSKTGENLEFRSQRVKALSFKLRKRLSHRHTSHRLESSKSRITMEHSNAQTLSISELFKTGDYSDLTIVCGDDRYKVHKAVVCPRSPFFKKACDGNVEESQTNEVKLPDDDPVAVRMMIEYLYRHTYTPPLTNAHDSTINTELSPTSQSDKRKIDMELWEASSVGNKRIKTLDSPNPSIDTPTRTGTSASRGGMGRDRGRGGREATSLSSRVTQPTQSPGLSIDPVPTPNPPSPSPPVAGSNQPPTANLCLHAKVYALGEKYGIGYLKLFALQRFEAEVEDHLQSKDFLLAIEEAYTSTVQENRRLRDAIAKTIKRNCHILKSPSVQATVKSTELGFDLLMKFASAQWRR